MIGLCKNGIVKLRDIFSYKFVKDSSYTLIATVILSISGILLNIIIGNHYSATGLGIFNQALAIYMVVSILAVFGLNSSVIKYISEFANDISSIKKIFSTALLIAFAVSVFVLGLIYLLINLNQSFFFNAEVTKSFSILVLSLPLFSLNKIFMGMANALREMKTYSILQSLRWILIIIFVLISTSISKSIYFLMYAFVFAEGILFLFLFFKYKKYLAFNGLLNSGWYKKNLVFGYKTVLLGFISQTNSKVDIFFIGFFLSNYYVGVYSFASTLVVGFLSLSSVVQLNINPIVSKLWSEKNITSIQKYTTRIARNMLVVVIPLVGLATFLYPFFINIFMNSSSYNDSIPVFYILAIGIIAPATFNFTGAYFAMANLLNLSFILIISRFIFNLIVCYIFISFFGYYGAAMATSLTYLFSFILSYFYMKKKMGINILQFKM